MTLDDAALAELERTAQAILTYAAGECECTECRLSASIVSLVAEVRSLRKGRDAAWDVAADAESRMRQVSDQLSAAERERDAAREALVMAARVVNPVTHQTTYEAIRAALATKPGAR